MQSTLEYVKVYMYVFQNQLNLLDELFSDEIDHAV